LSLVNQLNRLMFQCRVSQFGKLTIVLGIPKGSVQYAREHGRTAPA
jgi:hypothetical protein